MYHLEYIMLLVGTVGMIVGIILQVSAFKHRTDKAPSFPCLRLKYYTASKEEAATWFNSEKMYERVKIGGSLIAGSAIIMAVAFLVK